MPRLGPKRQEQARWGPRPPPCPEQVLDPKGAWAQLRLATAFKGPQRTEWYMHKRERHAREPKQPKKQKKHKLRRSPSPSLSSSRSPSPSSTPLPRRRTLVRGTPDSGSSLSTPPNVRKARSDLAAVEAARVARLQETVARYERKQYEKKRKQHKKTHKR